MKLGKEKMTEYYGIAGRTTYIFSKDFDECRAFDEFGSEKKGSHSILDAKVVNEANILSIISCNGSSGESEVYFNGKLAVIKRGIYEVYLKMRGSGYVGTMNFIKHTELEGRPTQVLFIYPKGAMTRGNLNNLLGISDSDWCNM